VFLRLVVLFVVFDFFFRVFSDCRPRRTAYGQIVGSEVEPECCCREQWFYVDGLLIIMHEWVRSNQVSLCQTTSVLLTELRQTDNELLYRIGDLLALCMVLVLYFKYVTKQAAKKDKTVVQKLVSNWSNESLDTKGSHLPPAPEWSRGFHISLTLFSCCDRSLLDFHPLCVLFVFFFSFFLTQCFLTRWCRSPNFRQGSNGFVE